MSRLARVGRWHLFASPLAICTRLAELFRVTINDLLLTAVAGGVRCLLSARGERVEGRTVQVLVPVGADHHGDHQLGNRVSAMLVRLPIGSSDPVDRLRSVSRAEASCKATTSRWPPHSSLSCSSRCRSRLWRLQPGWSTVNGSSTW